VRPLAKLGPMPTREASAHRKKSQCTPACRRGAVPPQTPPTQQVGVPDGAASAASTSPSRAQRAPNDQANRSLARRGKGAREHGFGGGRRPAAHPLGCARSDGWGQGRRERDSNPWYPYGYA